MARLGLFFVVCLSLIPSRTVCAQQPSPASPHDNEAVIIERLETRVSYENDGTGFREITAAIRMQSEAGPQSLGVLRFPYAKENEVLEFVYVRVRKPDGSVVITPDAYV